MPLVAFMTEQVLLMEEYANRTKDVEYCDVSADSAIEDASSHLATFSHVVDADSHLPCS